MNDVYNWVASSFLIIFWDSFLRGEGGVLGNGMLGMQMDNTNVLFCFVFRLYRSLGEHPYSCIPVEFCCMLLY